jgi:hypothetical protein
MIQSFIPTTKLTNIFVSFNTVSFAAFAPLSPALPNADVIPVIIILNMFSMNSAIDAMLFPMLSNTTLLVVPSHDIKLPRVFIKVTIKLAVVLGFALIMLYYK